MQSENNTEEHNLDNSSAKTDDFSWASGAGSSANEIKPTDNVSSQADKPDTSQSKPPKQSKKRLLLSIVAIIVVLIIGLIVGYFVGKKHGSNTMKAAQTPSVALKIPSGAVVVSQCTDGLGTQYALPADIPYGPIYDQYHGQVIGLEYMIPINDQSNMSSTNAQSAASQDMKSLSLSGANYNYIRSMIMPEGHAGLAVPHLMIDALQISPAESAKIVCSSNSSNSGNNSSESMPMNSSSSTPGKSSSGMSM